jgi:hypothetical protein
MQDVAVHNARHERETRTGRPVGDVRDFKRAIDAEVQKAAHRVVRPVMPALASDFIRREGDILTIRFNVRTINELNTGRWTHWTRQAHRKKLTKQCDAILLLAGKPPELPVVVEWTRFSSRGLDKHDQLAPAIKTPTDRVAAWLGCDDADPRIDWRYAQLPGTPGAGYIVARISPWKK